MASFVNFTKLFIKLNQLNISDLGWVQKWIQGLSLALILFNDPFCVFDNGTKSFLWYELIQSALESAFIAMLMFFWLLLLHSIASQDNIITIAPQNFFYPKIGICTLYFIYLFTMRLYLHIMYSQNPFFDLVTEQNLSMFYSMTYSFGIVLLSLYIIYLICITYKALNVIRFLKKSYRYAIGSTIFVMSVSSVLMLANG